MIFWTCSASILKAMFLNHDDVIKWKHFLRYWPFVRGIHRSRGALMLSLICAWTDGWVKNRYAGDLRRHRAHYDVTVMNGRSNENRQISWCQLVMITYGDINDNKVGIRNFQISGRLCGCILAISLWNGYYSDYIARFAFVTNGSLHALRHDQRLSGNE